MLKPGTYELRIFRTAAGACPYEEWLTELSEQMQQRITLRVFRMMKGQFGDFKAVVEDLYELRLFFGAGYRVYFGDDGCRAVILLAGGDKSTQGKDIKKAKDYWKTYREEHR